MSLLGTPVYANPDTPIWVSANGDTITGDLIVTGTVEAGAVEVANGGAGYQIVGAGPSTVSVFQHLEGFSPATYIRSNDPIVFSQIGAPSGNTSLVQSVQGANADVLTVGGTVSTIRLNLAAGAALSTVGTATILVGQTNIVVPTTSVTANSKIFVSHAGAAAAGPGAGAAQGGLTVNPALIVPGTSFRIDLVDPTTGIAVAASLVGVPVNWFFIN
jgi:hypothetical protein